MGLHHSKSGPGRRSFDGVMSDSRASENMREIFVRCTHFNFHIIACLRAKKALDKFQVSQLSGENSLIKRSQMVFEWMENDESVRDIVLRVMEENEQEHVANLMKGISNGPHIPLSQSRYNRLETITPKLMLIVRNDVELVAKLRAMGAISEIDRQDITQANKEYKRNWNLIEAILRRSDYAFNCLEHALRKTLQDHAANYLHEGQVVSVHCKTTQPEKDEVLSELLSRTILEESNEASSSDEKIFTAINGYSVHPVIAKPGQSIVFYFYCKAVDNMITFTELFISGDLQNMMEVIMNRLLLKIDPKHTGQLKAKLSLDESEILAVERFSGISDWMPLTLEEMTAESNMIYSAETTQTEYQIEDRIAAEIERITSWSGTESSVGTEIADVDSDIYAATSRKLYWKQEKRSIYKKFESLLTEEEELLNYFLPEKATSDKGWNWEQRRTILSQQLESLVDVQNYILKLLIPSETSSTDGLRQAVQNMDDKLKQQQQSWKNLKEQVLSGLGESKTSTYKPTSSTSINKIGVRLHEVRFLKYALKKRGELSGKGDLFSALESLMVEVSKEKQQTRNFRRADKYLTFSKLSDQPLQLFSDSEDEFDDDEYYFHELSNRKQEESIDLSYAIFHLRRRFAQTKKENRMLVKQLNETATARLEALNDFITLKAKLEVALNTEESETIKKLLEHQTPTVELPLKFGSDPILVQTIKTKAAENTKKDIRGLTILDNELFVVTRGSPEVEVYDSRKLSFSRRYNLSELISPEDIGSCSRNKCLYIIDSKSVRQTNEILRVDPNGMIIKIWLTEEKNCEWGLSVTDESNVILVVQARHKLREYSPDGQLIRVINLSTEAGIISPWHAIKLTNGHFVISHGHGSDDKHKVSIVDSNGKLQKSFGGTPGSTIAQMDSPRYLSVDGSGFVMVAEHDNSRVLLLDPDLNFRKELLSKEKHGMRFPERILLDESNGRLFVADFDGRGQILIFRLGN